MKLAADLKRRAVNLRLVRHKQNRQEEGKEVLIQWKDLPDSEATWEEYQTINMQFPDFHLGNKGSLLAGVM